MVSRVQCVFAGQEGLRLQSSAHPEATRQHMIDYLTTPCEGMARAHVVLAHGAGAMMDTPFMDTIATGLAKREMQVSRFEFPYMAKRRMDGKRRGPDPQKVLVATWLEVIDTFSSGLSLFIGGKSMGGRMASMVAEAPGVTGVICLGYPFHPPGKPDRLRTEHLETMTRPTLIVQGERDTFGRREEVLTYSLDEAVQITWIPDGDHSFKPRKKSGHTEADNLQRAIEVTAEFVAQHL